MKTFEKASEKWLRIPVLLYWICQPYDFRYLLGSKSKCFSCEEKKKQQQTTRNDGKQSLPETVPIQYIMTKSALIMVFSNITIYQQYLSVVNHHIKVKNFQLYKIYVIKWKQKMCYFSSL